MARHRSLRPLGQGCAAFVLSAVFTTSALAQTPPLPPEPPAPPSPPASTGMNTPPGRFLDLAPSCLTDLHIRAGVTPSVLSGNAVLTIDGHDKLELSLKDHSCDTDGSAEIEVPMGTNIGFRGNETHVIATGILGRMSGFTANGDVEIEQASDISLRMTGNGNVSIDRVFGNVKVQNFSNGDLSIGTAQSPDVELVATSSGDLTIKGGWIDTLSIRDMGSSDITAHVWAKAAHLAVYGSGNVTVDRVTKTLSQTHFGSGALNVEATGGAHVETTNKVDGNAIARDVLASLGSHLSATEASHLGNVPILLNTHSSHHHSLIRLIITLVIIGLILRRARRYRERTGQSFFANLWTDASEGYASFVRNWEARMRERRGEGAHTTVEPPHIHYTRRAVDLYEEVVHTAREQKQRHASRVHPSAPDAVSLNPALIRLNERLARLEPRLARMEQFVTSPDFALERQFRDLERSA
ncbi:hypothetical protein BAR24_02915 [Gluconobacter oxydans]|uniref:DUF2807 domain-containing protein n=1 Tax=Gluconobacter thailandicus TaxID=257438 RepID=UPI0002E74C9A|nr:DUF2807 domain-containing protein [Gluconobacter thailandicus]ANQ40505.1 hypothetical protein BAR24_02915 [Gluconobacter oxydans]